MKKLRYILIALAAVIVSALIIINLIKSDMILTLKEDGYAVSQDVTENLQTGVSDSINMEAVHADDNVWQSGSKCYVGNDKATISILFPLYFNNGTAVMPLQEGMLLFDKDFDTVECLPGMYISNGITYLQDHSQAEDEEYLFLQLSNGLYVNTMEMTVERTSEDTTVPLNGILCFAENKINYYIYKDASLEYHSVNTENATIKIGDLSLSYVELLKNLGLNSEDGGDSEQQDDSIGQETSEIPTDSDALYGIDQSEMKADSDKEVTEKTDTEKTNPDSISQDSQSADKKADTLSASGQNKDSGNQMQNMNDSETGDSASNTGSESNLSSDSEDGSKTSDQTEKSTDKKSSSGSSQEQSGSYTDANEPNQEETDEEEFEVPKISLSNFETGVYTLSMDMTVTDDPSESFYKTMVEVYWDRNGDGVISDTEIGSRKSVKKAGSLTVTALPPDTNIVVLAKCYYYWNGKKQNYICYNEFEVGELGTGLKTKSVDTLAPIYVNAKTSTEDSVYMQNQISLYELEFTGVSDNLSAIYRTYITMTSSVDPEDTYTYAINRSTSKKYANTPGKWTSYSEEYVLQSNTSYKYTIRLVDSFGNTLKTASGIYDTSIGYTADGDYSDIPTTEISGESRTCKIAPTATTRVNNKGVGKQSITIQVSDPDNTMTDQGLSFYIIDPESNKQVPVRLDSYESDGDDISTDDFYTEISFTALNSTWNLSDGNLETGKTYQLAVVANYDTNSTDNEESPETVIVANSSFLTTSLNTLGKMTYSISASNMTENSGTLVFQVNRSKTNADLMQYYFTELTANIAERSGMQKQLYSITLNKEKLKEAMYDPDDSANGGILKDEDKNQYYLNPDCYTATCADGYTTDNVRIVLRSYSEDSGENAWEYFTDPTSGAAFGIQIGEGGLSSGSSYVLTLDSKGETISYTSLIDKYKKEYDLNNSNISYRRLYFGTQRHMPSVTYDDILVVGDDAYIYGITIDDRDQAISSKSTSASRSVTVKVTLPAQNNVTVYNQSFDLTYAKDECGIYYAYIDQPVHLKNLSSGLEYKVDISADYLQLDSSVSKNVDLLDTQWSFTAGEGVNGELGLKSLEKNGGLFDVQVEIQASDGRGNLSDPQLYVTIEESAMEDISYEDVTSDYITDEVKQTMKIGTEEVDDGSDTGSTTMKTVPYDETFNYNFALDKQYRITLQVKYSNSTTTEMLTLDQVEFTTDETTYIISCEDDCKLIGEHLDGKFLVTEDLYFAENTDNAGADSYTGKKTATAMNTTTLSGYGKTFRGKIDFNGHTITMNYNKAPGGSYAFITTLASSGVIENMRLHFQVDGVNEVTGTLWKNFVRYNYGTLRNIVIVNDYSKGRFGHLKIAPVMINVGTIENFCVYYSGDSSNYVSYNCQGLCETNLGGTIRNGYVYSSRDLTIGSGVYTGSNSSRQYSSGLVGFNSNGGLIENVYGYMNIVTEYGSNMDKTGVICGYNNATIRNCFAIGDRYNYQFEDGVQQSAQIYPTISTVIGRNGTYGKTENVSYFSRNTYSSTEYGTYTRLTDYGLLTESTWYQSYFSDVSDWDISTQLTSGYMPRISMPSVINEKQVNVVIPTGTSVVKPTYESAEFTPSEDGTTGVLKLCFSNKSGLKISDINIDGLTITKEISQGLDAVSGQWIVEIAVKPYEYRDAYYLTSYNFSGASSASSCNEKIDCYFKFILTNDNWGTFNLDPDASYILGEDIDLNNDQENSEWFRYGQVGGTVKENFIFCGSLDGDGYTISNVKVDSSFIYQLSGGSVENLTVKNLTITGENGVNRYQGLIGQAQDSAVLQNVYILNASIPNGSTYTGTLAGYVNNIQVDSCGVNGTAVSTGVDASGVCQGGLIGKTYRTTVTKCYVVNETNINRNGKSQEGIGGIIGWAAGLPTIQQCYAQGSVESAYSNAGGIAGKTEGSISECWTNVSVVAKANVGGIAGYATAVDADYGDQASYNWGGLNQYAIQNNLVCGDLYASGLSSLTNRIIGTSAGGNEIILNSNNYALASQKLNNSASSTELDAAKLLKISELTNANLLRTTVGLGTGYRYSAYSDSYTTFNGTSAGELPVLYSSTDNTVMRYQTGLTITAGKAVAVTAEGKGVFNADGSYSDLTVTVYLGSESLTAGDADAETIRTKYSSSIDGGDMSVTLQSVEYTGQTMSVKKGDDTVDVPMFKLVYTVDQINKYLDSYLINVVDASGSKASAKIEFSIWNKLTSPSTETYTVEYLYRSIRNADDWNSIMGIYGTTEENFRIISDVDFEGGTPSAADVVVNRLEGLTSDGTQPAIKNFQTDASQQSLIAQIVTGSDNLSFSDVTINNTDSKGNTDGRVGIIALNSGTIENCTFVDITINSKSYSNVGCIAYSTGTIKDTTAQDVKITATDGKYIGCLVGYSNGPMTGCTVQSTSLPASYTGSEELPSDTACQINSGNATYVGGMVGGMFGCPTNCKVTGVKVSGTGTYYAGMVGYYFNKTSYGSSNADRNVVSCSSVSAKSYAAGALAYGSAAEYYWSVENSYIHATQDQAYGLDSYHSSSYIRYCTVKGCTIIADRNFAGGLCRQGPCYNCVVEDCTIRAVGSYAGGICGANPRSYFNIIVRNCEISASKYAGGMVGSYTAGDYTTSYFFRASIVYGCTISASEAYAGGLLGWSQNAEISNNSIYDCTISGGSYVGGLIGYAQGNVISKNQIYATVTADNNYAGGLIGYAMGFQYNTGNINCALQVKQNLISATISSGKYAAGLIASFDPGTRATKSDGSPVDESDGYYTYMKGSQFSGNVLAVNIESSTWAWYALSSGGANIAVNNFNQSDKGVEKLRIWNGSTGKRTGDANYTKVTSSFSSAWSSSLKGSTDILTVSTDQLKQNDGYTYSGDLGWSNSSGCFDLTASKTQAGYFPLLRESGSGLLSNIGSKHAGSLGTDSAGNARYPSSADLSELKIPVPMTVSTFNLSLMSLSMDMQIYAGGVDCLQVEFPDWDEECVKEAEEYSEYPTVTVSDMDGNVLFSGELKDSVIAFPYDFKTDVKVTVDSIYGSGEQTVHASDVKRYVMMYKNQGYVLSDGSLKNLDGQYLSSNGWSSTKEDALSVIHVMDGKVLGEDGTIYRVSDGGVSGSVQAMTDFCDTTEPIAAYTSNGTMIDAYRTFTLYGVGTDSETRQSGMLLARNSVSKVIGTDLDIDPLSIVYDSYLDTEYLILVKDGTLTNYQITDKSAVFPEDMRMDGVAQMSSSFDSDVTIAVVLYEDGEVLAFNYTNGEVVGTDTVEEIASETTFASVFDSALSSLKAMLLPGSSQVDITETGELIDMVEGDVDIDQEYENVLSGGEDSDSEKVEKNGLLNEKNQDTAVEKNNSESTDSNVSVSGQAGVVGNVSDSGQAELSGNATGTGLADTSGNAEGTTGTGNQDVNTEAVADTIQDTGRTDTETGNSNGKTRRNVTTDAPESSETDAQTELTTDTAADVAPSGGTGRSYEEVTLPAYVAVLSDEDDQPAVYQTAEYMGTGVDELTSENEKVHTLIHEGILAQDGNVSLGAWEDYRGILLYILIAAGVCGGVGSLFFLNNRKKRADR